MKILTEGFVMPNIEKYPNSLANLKNYDILVSVSYFIGKFHIWQVLIQNSKTLVYFN